MRSQAEQDTVNDNKLLSLNDDLLTHRGVIRLQ